MSSAVPKYHGDSKGEAFLFNPDALIATAEP
jgi:hypothetical protein